MPFKTFTAAVLSSSDMNTYLMKQGVISCTSGTRPSSPVQGMEIYETDTNLIQIYNGSAWVALGGWQSYTPPLTNITLGNGTLTGRYALVGDTIEGHALLVGGTTTAFAAGSLSVGLPVAPAAGTSTQAMIGWGQVNNNSAASRRNITVSWTGTTTGATFGYEGGNVSNTAPFTFGNLSVISYAFSYPRA